MPLGSVLARGPSNRVSAAIKTLDYSPTPSWFHLGQKQAWESEDYVILAIVAGWQSGKALSIDTPIPTPSGFVPMGDLKDGDTVLGRDGKPCRVLMAHDIYMAQEVYRVTFCDGAEIIADADHQWFAESWRQRRNRQRDEYNGKLPRHSHCAYGSVVTTRQMAAKVKGADGGAEWSMPLPGPAEFPEASLPIDPYILGCWLGDGNTLSAQITTEDQEVVQSFIDAGLDMVPAQCQNNGKATSYLIGEVVNRRRSFATQLRELGVLGNKHIPEQYLTASIEQRLALLQGLMDTDGHCGANAKKGDCEYCSILPGLAYGCAELIRSLGMKARVKVHRSALYGKDCGLRYRVMFRPTMPVFRLKRKLERQSAPTRPDVYARYVRKIEPVAPRLVRCITVDAPDSLYLAGREYIVTHNSVCGAPWLVREIQLRKDATDFAAISPSYPLMTKKVLPELEKALKGLAKWRAGDKQFRSTKEGLKRLGRTKHFIIHLGHCQNPESLESATYGGVWWDEPGQCEEANYHVLRARLAVMNGRMLMTSRPYEFNWYKRLIWDQRYHPDTNPKSKIKVVNFRSQDNPEFKMDLEQVRKEMPEWLYAMRYEGIFTRPAGAIYDCFDPAIHYRRPWKMPLPEAEIVIGLDFGLVNMAAIWGVRWLDQEGNNCIHWVGTYHAGQRSTEEHVTAIMGQIKTSMKGLGIPKWRIVRAVGGAASEDQWRIQFAGAGLAIEKPPYHLVEPAIQCVYRQLKKGHFTFEPGLGKLKTEFEEYAFETTDEGDVLDKIKEKAKYHRLDSLRYIGSAEFPLTPEEERASNVTRRSNAGTEK